MNIKEQSLKDALTHLVMEELPKQYKEASGEQWIKAVVLVKKLDLTQSYAIAERNADGRISYKKDFGTISPISGLISVYPYELVNKDRFFDFSAELESKKETLVTELGEDMAEIVAGMTEAEVDDALSELATEKQLAASNDANSVVSLVEHAHDGLDDKEELEPEGDFGTHPDKAVKSISDFMIREENQRKTRKNGREKH